MPPLLVIAGLPDLSPALGPQLPELPALNELLRLGDTRAVDADWRSGLLRDLGDNALGAEAPAAVAAAALPLPQGAAVCLATPVHAVAGLSRVHLHAAGVLRLDAAHGAAFAAAFAAQFGDELHLHAVGDGWLVEAACAAAANDDDPLDLIGMPLERSAARSPEQRQLRRFGAEIEMWLAGLPLNDERVRRGELPVNLLWLWGGGRVRIAAAPRRHSPLRLHAAGNDAWMAGCAALCGAELLPLPDTWDAVPQAQEAVIILQANALTEAGQWQRWDEQWFAPLLRDLRARRIEALRLRCGRRALHVRRRFWSAPWRRGRRWWRAATA